MNFPGGLDPEHLRRLQEQIQMAQSYYEPILKRVSQDENLRRAFQNAARMHAQRERAIQGIDWQAIQRSLETATRTLRSPGFQSYMESVHRANEAADRSLGADGLAASQGIASRRASESSADLERTVERVRNGEADKVLQEAAELAASPEVRQEIERADKDAILALAQEQEDQGPPSATEPVPESQTDFEMEAEYAEVSKQDLLELHDVALRLLFVLGAAFSAALVVASPLVSLAALMAAINALMLLLQWSERQIAAWEDEEH